MTMDLRVPGRPTSLDQLRPGGCFLIAGPEGPDLALLVARDRRREALLLNRRHAVGGELRIVSNHAPDAGVLVLPGAILAPSGALGDIAFGRAALAPGALHLGDGCAYLCGRDDSGRTTTFDLGSGSASAIDPADLPHARRWRVLMPEAAGMVTIYEAVPI
jgi:hypothetical protein